MLEDSYERPHISFNNLWINGRIEHYVGGYHYFEDSKNKFTFSRSFGTRQWLIEQGFHSYVSLEKAKQIILRDYMHDHKVKKFIIPKGAKYYVNKDRGEYVSSEIIAAWGKNYK